MEKEVEKMDFYQELRQKINKWAEGKGKGDKYLPYILAAPDFFYVLVKLLLDERVPVKEKAFLGVAIAYFIAPFEIIPEGIFGPVGYADDVVIAVWVLNRIINEVGKDIVLEYWPGEQNMLELIQNILAQADQWLGKGAYKKLKNYFAGKTG
jgi:uncharacterized membrane protein YkvA (DUF1232 family)